MYRTSHRRGWRQLCAGEGARFGSPLQPQHLPYPFLPFLSPPLNKYRVLVDHTRFSKAFPLHSSALRISMNSLGIH